MKRALKAFGLGAIAAALLAYPVASRAYFQANSWAGCTPDYDNQVGTTAGYYYFEGANFGPHELGVVCDVFETSDHPKNIWRSVTVRVRDYSANGSVRAMACLESEIGFGGGCAATHASTGKNGDIQTLTIPSADLQKLWVSSSGYAVVDVRIPPADAGQPRSSLIGFYPND